MENVLIADGVRTYYPEVGPLSLAISPGERCYLQGSEQESTALFEILTGLRRPNEGRMTILGQDIYALKGHALAAFRRDYLAAIPKGVGFLPELMLIEQICLPMILAGLSQEEIRERIRRNTLTYLPPHSLYNSAKRCSGRTLALAGLLRAAVMDPPILILNASFDHLNRKDSQLVWQEAQSMLKDDMAFLYLGCAPAPGEISWTKQMQISVRRYSV